MDDRMLAENNDLARSRDHEGWHHWAGKLARGLLYMRRVAIGMRLVDAIAIAVLGAVDMRHGCKLMLRQACATHLECD